MSLIQHCTLKLTRMFYGKNVAVHVMCYNYHYSFFVGGEAKSYYPVQRAPASDAGEITGYPVWVHERPSVATGVNYRPRVN